MSQTTPAVVVADNPGDLALPPGTAEAFSVVFGADTSYALWHGRVLASVRATDPASVGRLCAEATRLLASWFC